MIRKRLSQKSFLKSFRFYKISVTLCDFSVILCVTIYYGYVTKQHREDTELHRGLLRQPLHSNE